MVNSQIFFSVCRNFLSDTYALISREHVKFLPKPLHFKVNGLFEWHCQWQFMTFNFTMTTPFCFRYNLTWQVFSCTAKFQPSRSHWFRSSVPTCGRKCTSPLSWIFVRWEWTFYSFVKNINVPWNDNFHLIFLFVLLEILNCIHLGYLFNLNTFFIDYVYCIIWNYNTFVLMFELLNRKYMGCLSNCFILKYLPVSLQNAST